MAQLQRIIANESGPWTATTGSKQMSFTIDIPSSTIADLDRSFIILRTTLTKTARAANDCVRQISLGYQQPGAQRYPMGYNGSCMLRDVQLHSETMGTLVATQYQNVAGGAVRVFGTGDSELRTRAAAGEGWQDMTCYFGNAGVSNGGRYGNGNYTSAWLSTVRSGNVPSAVRPYVDLVVPLSDVLGGFGKLRVPLSKLGRTTMTFSVEQSVPIASAYARDDQSLWPAIAYTYTDATHIIIDELPRNLDGDCPFFVGMGLTTTETNAPNTVANPNVAGIALNGTGQIVLTLSAGQDPHGDGNLFERRLVAEPVAWSVSEASLVLATFQPQQKIPAHMSMPYMTLVDIPWGPSATQDCSNTFTLPQGTVGCFLVNPRDTTGAQDTLAPCMNPMRFARFALDGVDLTNRSLDFEWPPSALYMDRINAALALYRQGDGLTSLQENIFCALPSAAWGTPTATPNSQLQVSITNAGAWNASIVHLFCIVMRTLKW